VNGGNKGEREETYRHGCGVVVPCEEWRGEMEMMVGSSSVGGKAMLRLKLVPDS